jgi:putative ABC transport system permease protein
MIAITLCDLRFRARQFLIAVIGASLVFAMSLLLTGMAAGFSVEVHQTVTGTGAAAWVMAQGSSGRISSLPPIPAAQANTAARSLERHGVVQADPIIIAPQAASVGSKLTSLVLVGYRPGGLGTPKLAAGRAVEANGEAVVDERLKLGIGSHFVLSGLPFTVVGTVTGRTLLGGQPEAFVTLSDAQQAIYGGRPLVGAILASSYPSSVPPNLVAMPDSEVEARTLSQMTAAISSIDNSRAFMWFIAAVIVAALVYVTSLERTRDFAVLKALGSSSVKLFGGLAIEAVIVSLASAALAAIAAQFMTGLFAQPVDIPASAFVVLPFAALAVGLLSSLAALRRAVSVDPAMAFMGA